MKESKPKLPTKLPKYRYDLSRHGMTRCQADDDGYCDHYKDCPQLRDNEPFATGRHCPLDKVTDDDE